MPGEFPALPQRPMSTQQWPCRHHHSPKGTTGRQTGNTRQDHSQRPFPQDKETGKGFALSFQQGSLWCLLIGPGKSEAAQGIWIFFLLLSPGTLGALRVSWLFVINFRADPQAVTEGTAPAKACLGF